MEEVRAPMPGVVHEVEVSQGQIVAVGAPLVVVESMKMEIPIEAPVAGSVVAVHVAVGQSIEENQLIVTLQTS